MSEKERKIIRFLVNDKYKTIDEDDYNAFQEFMSKSRHAIPEEKSIQITFFIADDEDRRINELRMQSINVKSIHGSIGRLQNLELLDVHNTKYLEFLPKEIGDLAMLKNLNLAHSGIKSLPHSIGRLTNLKSLDLSDTKLSNLPEEIGNLAGLEVLNLRYSRYFKSLPPSIGRLTNLKSLDLSDTRLLSYLPEEIGNLAGLQVLTLNGTTITSLPPSIGLLTNLKSLDLSDTELTDLPEEIGNLAGLQVLTLNGITITSLPPSIGRLTNLKRLYLNGRKDNPNRFDSFDLSRPKLSYLPEEIGDLASLEVLDLGSTRYLQFLPKEIGDLAMLKNLSLARSRIKSLPPSIGRLTSLKCLDLSGSGIKSLPPSIGRLTNLERLDLLGTNLSNLPEEIGDLVMLNTLVLQETMIASLPPSIGRLRNLGKLNLLNTKKLLNLPEEILNLTDNNSPCSLIKLHLMGAGLDTCPVAKKFMYAMTRNLSRMRIGKGFGATTTEEEQAIRVSPPMWLWPLLLHNAKRAFAIPFEYPIDHHPKSYIDQPRTSYFRNMETPDAIYQLLVDGRKSFVVVLLNRDSRTPMAKIPRQFHQDGTV